MSRENVELIRREYADFNRTGALNATRYHPEFEWHDFEGSPIPVRRGFDAWQQWAVDVSEAFGKFIVEPQELIDLGDKVVSVVVLRGRAKGSGVDLEQIMPSFAVVWTVRDGTAIRGAAFRSKAEALEAAGLLEA